MATALAPRAAVLRGEAYQLTPLYGDIPWEFLLPPKNRTRTVIDALVISARNSRPD